MDAMTSRIRSEDGKASIPCVTFAFKLEAR
jgi:hypothetical protein